MSFKKFDLDKDVYNNDYFVYEPVQLVFQSFTGSLIFPNHFSTGAVSGSYYVDVYDRNHTLGVRLLSLSYGHTTSSIFHTGAFEATYQEPKLKLYRLFAKRLLGSEEKKFNLNGREIDEACFISVCRSQYKDSLRLRDTKIYNFGNDPLADVSSSVFASFAGNCTYLLDQNKEYRGIVFHEAGICVIEPRVFNTGSLWSGSLTFEELAKGVSGSTHNDLLFGYTQKIERINFVGSSRTESTYFRCTAEPEEFNYSSNPSSVTPEGRIRTTISGSSPTTYITQIGLLGENQELIAVAKLYKPLKKHFGIGMTITARIDH